MIFGTKAMLVAQPTNETIWTLSAAALIRLRTTLAPRSLYKETEMRRKNPRVVMVGSVLLAMAIVFFFFMLSIASKSTDPAELMRTVGTVSGVVSGLAITMMIVGGIGKRAAAGGVSDAD